MEIVFSWKGLAGQQLGFHSSMTPLGFFGISAIVNTTSPCAGNRMTVLQYWTGGIRQS